jgi:hypothetical protein
MKLCFLLENRMKLELITFSEISQSHRNKSSCFLPFVEAKRKQNKTIKVMKVNGELLERWKGKGNGERMEGIGG